MVRIITAALLFGADYYPDEPLESVTLRFKDRRAPVVVPIPAHPPHDKAHPAQTGSGGSLEGPLKSPGCSSAILRALVRAGKPLTGDAVIDALADQHESYSESAVEKTLAQLVGMHVLDNPPGARPRGYRLAGD